jgi:hypothetical protein
MSRQLIYMYYLAGDRDPVIFNSIACRKCRFFLQSYQGGKGV